MPSVPNVTVGIEEGAIIVRWDPASGADSYQIRSWWDGLAAWKTLDANLTTTEFVHTDTTEGVEYYYIVRASNQAGRSDWSSPFASETAPAGSGAQGPTATPVPPTTTPTTTPAESQTTMPQPTNTLVPTQTVGSSPTPYPTYTPYPTPEPTATVDSSQKCSIARYAAGDERWSTIKVPLIQNDTLVAYRNKFGENLDDLDIIRVNYYGDGRIEIWYLGDGPYPTERVVSEQYRGCTYIGHTAWQSVTYR